MNDFQKWWLRSKWIVLAILLETLAVAYAHLAELRDLLPADLYQWLAFLLPVLLVILRSRSEHQAPLNLRRKPHDSGEAP